MSRIINTMNYVIDIYMIHMIMISISLKESLKGFNSGQILLDHHISHHIMSCYVFFSIVICEFKTHNQNSCVGPVSFTIFFVDASQVEVRFFARPLHFGPDMFCNLS